MSDKKKKEKKEKKDWIDAWLEFFEYYRRADGR